MLCFFGCRGSDVLFLSDYPMDLPKSLLGHIPYPTLRYQRGGRRGRESKIVFPGLAFFGSPGVVIPYFCSEI